MLLPSLFALVLGYGSVLNAASKIIRIGELDGGSPTQTREALWRQFEKRIQELGYIEGRTITFSHRWADGSVQRLDALARDLVASKVDIIVTFGTPATFAASRATSRIPIVMTIATESAVTPSLVKSLARPGKNVTGLVTFPQMLGIKRLELAKEIVPSASLVAILGVKTNPNFTKILQTSEDTAKALGVSLVPIGIRDAESLESAFSNMKKAGVDAVVVIPNALTGSRRDQAVKLATNAKIPAVWPDRGYISAGGLAAMGANLSWHFRQTASYVDKVLKGMSPAELPVERSTTFDIVVNLKAAKAVHIAIPRAVLLRADAVIE